MEEKEEQFEKHKVPLDSPGLAEHQKGTEQKQEDVRTKEETQAIENAAKGIRDDLPAMQASNLEEAKRQREQAKGDVEGLKGQPGAPGQGPLVPELQVVNPGDQVVAATVTLNALVAALYPTNTAPTPPTNYTWVYPGVLQGVYGDLSLITLRFEARQYQPSQIRTY